jgi:hypothetical protein
MFYYFINILLNLDGEHFTENFYIYIHVGNWSIIFFCVSYVGFGFMVIQDSKNVLEVFLPFWFY